MTKFKGLIADRPLMPMVIGNDYNNKKFLRSYKEKLKK
jgi:hypothetical protein